MLGNIFALAAFVHPNISSKLKEKKTRLKWIWIIDWIADLLFENRYENQWKWLVQWNSWVKCLNLTIIFYRKDDSETSSDIHDPFYVSNKGVCLCPPFFIKCHFPIRLTEHFVLIYNIGQDYTMRYQPAECFIILVVITLLVHYYIMQMSGYYCLLYAFIQAVSLL